ncbi:MAG: PAS domain S-box protein, partial [Acetobacteraceae bacterium]|nr:PAS domain S-box protein [Acetobacteraceae bacterium]
LAEDQAILATLDVLIKILPPALFTDVNLSSLAICRAVNLSLEHGNCDASCVAYVRLGMIAGLRFGNYDAGFRFGRLGYQLVEQRGLRRFQAATYMLFGAHLIPWTRHVRAGRDLLRRAFEIATKSGDLTFAAFSCGNLNSNLLAAGDPLHEVEREAQNSLEFAQKARFGFVIDILTTQLALVRTLRGSTSRFGSFNDESFDELRIERRFSANPNLALPECWYWIRKLQARFLAGEFASALEASSRAQQLLWTLALHLERADYHLYSALSHAGISDSVAADQRQQHMEAMASHYQQLAVWAERCPENFEHRAALVSAEMARLEGRELHAMRCYEQAIRAARASGFVHNEAIAYERASAFYRARGFDEFAELCLRKARYSYLRWGAGGKVRQLDRMHPHLREEERQPDPMSTIGAPVDHLDLATVIKVSQAVSSEMVLGRLVATLLRTAIEQAGAERGLLLLLRRDALRIEAEAITDGDAVIVQLCDKPASPAALPESVLHYVQRTRESVILDDASAENPFSADAYIRQHHARSILCLPFLNQAKLIGVLFLENNLAPCVFALGRLAVLKLLASQAAIALENARLYSDLAEREAKIRRLVDANVIGICIWELEGRILEANDAYLRIVGYDRQDLGSGRLRWTDLTPSEWRDRQKRQWIPELKMTGTVQPFEKEYIRKDGSRVPVLVGMASFDETGNQGVSFVLDLTERKRAEAQARESERRYREVQTELAHANRIATMGQLSASIAHEANQPIGAALTNAQAALRWLGSEPPNLEEVRLALARIVANSSRAGNVIGRIRALIKKDPPRKDALAINDAILEVIALTQGEAVKNGVSLQTKLADSLPRIQGDRVQLQQVILNLIINAIEAMSGVSAEPRELLISTGKADRRGVVVAVRDSGPGLEASTLDRLFQAFYTTKPGGLGMGLSICRSIIEAHGGQLWAEANQPRGAIFQFTVPAQL